MTVFIWFNEFEQIIKNAQWGVESDQIMLMPSVEGSCDTGPTGSLVKWNFTSKHSGIDGWETYFPEQRLFVTQVYLFPEGSGAEKTFSLWRRCNSHFSCFPCAFVHCDGRMLCLSFPAEVYLHWCHFHSMLEYSFFPLALILPQHVTITFLDWCFCYLASTNIK